jgi:hypothetical protein
VATFRKHSCARTVCKPDKGSPFINTGLGLSGRENDIRIILGNDIPAIDFGLFSNNKAFPVRKIFTACDNYLDYIIVPYSQSYFLLNAACHNALITQTIGLYLKRLGFRIGTHAKKNSSAEKNYPFHGISYLFIFRFIFIIVSVLKLKK